MSETIEKWFCIACKFHLAFVENKRSVRIKRKDLYVEVEGGRVTVTCPRCGKRNTITDDRFIEAQAGPT